MSMSLEQADDVGGIVKDLFFCYGAIFTNYSPFYQKEFHVI